MTNDDHYKLTLFVPTYLLNIFNTQIRFLLHFLVKYSVFSTTKLYALTLLLATNMATAEAITNYILYNHMQSDSWG
jgi:hypothetical protein